MEKQHGDSGNGVEGRLTAVEGDVRQIKATMATKEDLQQLAGEVQAIKAIMATKEDLQKLAGEVKAVNVRVDSIAETMATKADLKELKADILEGQNKHLLWMMGGMSVSFLAATGAMVSAILAIGGG